MPDEWYILNVDRQEYTEPSHQQYFRNFRKRIPTYKPKYLRPLREPPNIPLISRTRNNSYSPLIQRGLLKLPSELILYIAQELVSNVMHKPAFLLESLICFAATCHRCWDIVNPCIRKAAQSVMWPGCRLLCASSHMTALPPGVLTEKEQYTLEECLSTHKHMGEDEGCLFHHVEWHYKEKDNLYTTLRRIALYSGVPYVVEMALKRMLPVNYKSRIEPEALRNLSKKAFVRSEAVDLLNTKLLRDRRDLSFSLGDALVVTILWSTKTSKAQFGPEDLSVGPWAGDRFDIITMKEFKQVGDYSEWRDASDEVCATLEGC